MTNQQTILSATALSIGFKNAIVRNINMNFSRGEICAIVGVNGSGKSTFLKTITGLQKKKAGEINLYNKNIDDYTLPAKSKLISYVSSSSMAVNLTIEELVGMGRYPYTGIFGKLSERDKKIIAQMIELVGIGHIKHKKTYEISDGERQRAMIARALAQEAEIIILDEPTAYLDLPNRYEITYLLKKLSREKNRAILFSSHDLNIVLQVVDKVLLIHDHQIIEGAPEDLVISNAINQVFANEKIKLDFNTGDFVYNSKNEKNIFVNGNGPLFDWTLKALNRVGYNCICNQKGEINVLVKDQNAEKEWVIEKNSDKFVFGTIYELTNFLKTVKI